MTQHSAPASQNETRDLMVSVWLGFALAVADVSVAGDDGTVTITSVRLEPRDEPGHIFLSASDLDRVALVRVSGPITLRAAIEQRAREEAFA